MLPAFFNLCPAAPNGAWHLLELYSVIMISQTDQSFDQPVEVLKFGGSSLATPERVQHAAQCIQRRVLAGNKVIAIVSAMGSTTNDLNQLARQVSTSPSRRELDMLISAGERISMALISMALNDLGCPAISFTGSQAGVLTQGSHSDAEILDLKPIRVVEALNSNKVAVVAGFQGADPVTKDVTTLGRGGSDITAVAFAHHFKAEYCRFIKDVPGIQPADPKWVKTAKVIEEVPLIILRQACEMGAKVLNPRCLELASKCQVKLHLGSIELDGAGSTISNLELDSRKPMFLSVLPTVLEVNDKHETEILELQKNGTLPRTLTRYSFEGKTYWVTHPDHFDFYASKFEDLRITYEKLQLTAVIYSNQTSEKQSPPSINNIYLYNSFFVDNIWVQHWLPDADLKECGSSIFQLAWSRD